MALFFYRRWSLWCNILSNYYSKERSSLVSVKDALQLMLAFGAFIIEQI
ncbi:putative holin-like toxin [Lactobacillus mellis]|nr:putative holin-like toxin [Bombilactobacillus mellis]